MEGKNKMTEKKVINQFDGSLLPMVLVVVIAIAIYAMLGSPVSVGITSLSNTTGHTGLNGTLTGGYTGWSEATTAAYKNSATLATLAYWLIPLIVILILVRKVT